MKDMSPHWDGVYTTKAPNGVSWYRPHLDRSLELIQIASPDHESSIIDVGGGESTLVDDLLALGYQNLTLLDISKTALAVTKERLGADAQRIRWLCADVTQGPMIGHSYDLWHDRAVFHFLLAPEERSAYVQTVANALKPGGHIIVSTFGPQGPTKCSGLNVIRYDANSLHGEFGNRFQLIESSEELHETPFGTTQQFLYCYCRMA